MINSDSNDSSPRQRDFLKTLLVGAVIGALGTMCNDVSASCDSEREACYTSSYNGWAAQTTDCAEERGRKYDDCGNIWAQLLMTPEERDTCRSLAASEYDHCIADADRAREWYRAECDSNWEICS